MAKTKHQRLKVFQAQLGFFDTVVAAPSRAAALRAWGVHQDLFASGQAQVAEDEKAIEAAKAHPETPLQRAVGSTDAFALKSAHLPKVPDAPKKLPTRQKSKAEVKVAAPNKTADRSVLDAAEAALHSLDGNRKREEATLRRRQSELDAESQKAQETYVSRREAAVIAVSTALDAYKKDGGED